MFTSQPIGFVGSPYKDASEVPRGLGAQHVADGALKILPEFEPGLTDIEGFSILSSFGSLIARLRLNCVGPTCSVRRPLTIGRMACLRLDLRAVRTRLD